MRNPFKRRSLPFLLAIFVTSSTAAIAKAEDRQPDRQEFVCQELMGELSGSLGKDPEFISKYRHVFAYYPEWAQSISHGQALSREELTSADLMPGKMRNANKKIFFLRFQREGKDLFSYIRPEAETDHSFSGSIGSGRGVYKSTNIFDLENGYTLNTLPDFIKGPLILKQSESHPDILDQRLVDEEITIFEGYSYRKFKETHLSSERILTNQERKSELSEITSQERLNGTSYFKYRKLNSWLLFPIQQFKVKTKWGLTKTFVDAYRPQLTYWLNEGVLTKTRLKSSTPINVQSTSTKETFQVLKVEDKEKDLTFYLYFRAGRFRNETGFLQSTKAKEIFGEQVYISGSDSKPEGALVISNGEIQTLSMAQVGEKLISQRILPVESPKLLPQDIEQRKVEFNPLPEKQNLLSELVTPESEHQALEYAQSLEPQLDFSSSQSILMYGIDLEDLTHQISHQQLAMKEFFLAKEKWESTLEIIKKYQSSLKKEKDNSAVMTVGLSRTLLAHETMIIKFLSQLDGLSKIIEVLSQKTNTFFQKGLEAMNTNQNPNLIDRLESLKRTQDLIPKMLFNLQIQKDSASATLINLREIRYALASVSQQPDASALAKVFQQASETFSKLGGK